MRVRLLLRTVRLAPLAAIVLGFAAGCDGRDATAAPAIDLVALFPFTERGQQVRSIDLGTPAADPHLVSGWSASEVLPDGTSVVRAVARKAEIRFSIDEPTAGRIVLRCGVPEGNKDHAVPVIASLNRRRLGFLRLRPGLEEHTLRLPLRAQRKGMNELALASPFFGRRGARSGIPSRDPESVNPSRRANRRDAPPAACDFVRFEGVRSEPGAGDDGGVAGPEGADPPGASVVRHEDRLALRVEPGASAEFHLRVPTDQAALVFDLAASQSALGVTLATENGEEHPLEGVRDADGARHFDLSPFGGRIARLTLEARGEAPVLVVAPRVTGGAAQRGGTEDLRYASASASETSSRGGAAGPRFNVLLYVIDTLRADHLSAYGYARSTSPNIDAVAADGLLFTHAVAQASWTTPAVASILTGRYPSGHGALTLGQGMRRDVPTLAELLRAHGYRTAGFVTNGNVTGSLGFQRGFDEYVYLPEDRARRTVHVPVDELNARALAWLRKQSAVPDGPPFLLYVHASDPHAPYAPPARLLEKFHPPGEMPPIAAEAEPTRAITRNRKLRTPENLAYLRALYDAEIAFTDEGVGQLLAEVKKLGLYDRTLVVIVADHGEELDEHGRIGHGHSLYREQTHVPLVVRPPGGVKQGLRVSSLAQQVDILPTVLAELGIALPPGLDGSPLLDQSGRPAVANEDAEAFSETRLGFPPRASVETSGWKVIETDTPRTRLEVYDLGADPGEKKNLSSESPVVLGYGRQQLGQRAAASPRERWDPEQAALRTFMDTETRRRLEALGYVARERKEKP